MMRHQQTALVIIILQSGFHVGQSVLNLPVLSLVWYTFPPALYWIRVDALIASRVANSFIMLKMFVCFQLTMLTFQMICCPWTFSSKVISQDTVVFYPVICEAECWYIFIVDVLLCSKPMVFNCVSRQKRHDCSSTDLAGRVGG